MYRICILTLFYEIPAFTVYWIIVASDGWQINATIFYSISMYLMMEHNDKAYAKFLRCTYRLKLHYLCCCYRGIISNQVRDSIIEQESNEDETTNAVTTKTEGDYKDQNNATTTYETHDISIGHGKIPACAEDEVTQLSVDKIE